MTITCPACGSGIPHTDSSSAQCPVCGYFIAPRAASADVCIVSCPVCEHETSLTGSEKSQSCPACGSMVFRPSDRSPGSQQSARTLPEMTIPCRTCTRPVLVGRGQAFAECPACGSLMTRPADRNEAGQLLRQAELLRDTNAFHLASRLYRQALTLAPDSHEALWGAVLCRYGVIYTDTPDGGRIPVIHLPQETPVREDADFRMACSCAPADVRIRYEADAAYLDSMLARMRTDCLQLPQYDVFLCCRTRNSEDNLFTREYMEAFRIFLFLQQNGLRVFFAPQSLKTPGVSYEVDIYHALKSARTMLIFCADENSLSSQWTRSELQRFLDMSLYTPGKRIIPLLCANAGALPREIAQLRLEAIRAQTPEELARLIQILRG